MTKSPFATRAMSVTLGLSALIAIATAALAHHGFQGRYDLGRPVWIEGSVTSAYFGSPHSELTVAIPSDLALPRPTPDFGPAATFLRIPNMIVAEDLNGQAVELELPPTAQYQRLGPRVAIGDRIAAVAIRNCEPPHQLNVQWLRLADGSVESREAAMSYMVEQC